jgi:DNA repair exonuclease SbcCD ATPase subunit
VNDGNCDCCDGSDEFSKKTCQKTCIDLSKKEYDQFLEQFNNIESNLKEIDNSYIEMLQEHNKKIDIIIKNYHELEELNEKHFLILSYLNKLRNNIGEDVFDRNIDYQDINGFIIRDLKDSLNNIGEQIYQKEQFLEENYNLINNLSLMITFLGKEKECISTNYKGGSLSACLMGGVEFSGYKGRYWNRRSLG